jgi:hypothetical protein
MKHPLAQSLRRALIPLFAFAGFIVSSCGPDSRGPTGPDTDPSLASRGSPPGLAKALAAQAKHTDRLLKVAGVVGTAVGLSADGKAEVRLLTKTPGVRGLPSIVDGVPVSVVVTGEIRAIPAAANAPVRPAAAGGVKPTARFTRPVPIGVSTGNAGECSSGTIGARVKSATGTTYALSNNHVYALENHAAPNSKVLQPGRYDLNCATNVDDYFLGNLANYVQIKFDGTSNRVDAAIAAVSTANLDNKTPSNGYGTPSAATVSASLNQTVKKYGRTTGLTTGSVVGLNTTVNVGYSSGTARFVGQLWIRGKGQFSRAGDSGSLIVDASNQPVGLLFAGSSNGDTFANQIGDVLNALNVSIDGN